MPGPDGPAGRPAEDAPGAPDRRLGRASPTPPEELHDRAVRGRRRSAQRSREPAQIAGQQRRQVGVEDGRRAALVLTEAAAAPPRRPRRAAPGTARGWPRRAAARGPGRGTRTAGRSRPPRARGVRSRPSIRSTSRSVEVLDDAVGADPLAGADPQLDRGEGSGAVVAEAVERRPVLAGDLEQVGEAGGGDQGGARPAALEQGVGAHGHPVGEVADRRAGAPACPSTASIAAITPADWSPGVVGDFAVWMRSPSTRTASVNVPPTSTPSSTPPITAGPRRRR